MCILLVVSYLWQQELSFDTDSVFLQVWPCQQVQLPPSPKTGTYRYMYVGTVEKSMKMSPGIMFIWRRNKKKKQKQKTKASLCDVELGRYVQLTKSYV